MRAGLSLYVRAMSDSSNSICFIVRGTYGASATFEKQAVTETVETSDGSEVTLDEYASYMSETHIANLGGQYQRESQQATSR